MNESLMKDFQKLKRPLKLFIKFQWMSKPYQIRTSPNSKRKNQGNLLNLITFLKDQDTTTNKRPRKRINAQGFQEVPKMFQR